MRSSVPMPGNPWPHDMHITVEDHPKALVDLLWVREAWGLEPLGDQLPPLLSPDIDPAPARSALKPGRRELWQEAWPEVWAAAVDHAGHVDTGAVISELHRSAVGSDERARLFRELFGPEWRDSFGGAAFDDRYDAWLASDFTRRSRTHARPPGEEPERVSVASLTHAWNAGLTRVITIPCAGTYTRSIGPHVLLVTAETREDPGRYDDALRRFS